jgi:hypothetical protein
MTRSGNLYEGRDGTARVMPPTGRLFRPDRARGIDRIIDYFGGSFGVARWRTASARDTLPISAHDRGGALSAIALSVDRRRDR